jgi:hypothetical protein
MRRDRGWRGRRRPAAATKRHLTRGRSPVAGFSMNLTPTGLPDIIGTHRARLMRWVKLRIQGEGWTWTQRN